MNDNYQNLENSNIVVPLNDESDTQYHHLDEGNDICRICYEGETARNKLISPCLCDGTSQFVHEECLKQWRYTNSSESRSRSYCMECGYKYKIEYIHQGGKTYLLLLALAY